MSDTVDNHSESNDRENKVKEKMKSLLESTNDKELMTVEEIRQKVREVVRTFDENK